MKVFLSGGLHSNWQDRVKNRLSLANTVWIDPRKHLLTDPEQYTPVNLAGIKAADVVFAYLEKENPGGYDMSFELGYAKALGKWIILVIDEDRDYFTMPVASADIVFTDFDSACFYLENLGLMIDGDVSYYHHFR
jgi:nucleoside 2-deoxyribosyltransferase